MVGDRIAHLIMSNSQIMRKINALTLGAIACSMLIGSAHAQTRVSCEQEVREVNQFLSEKGMPVINDVKALVHVLRQIKQYERLPRQYLTSNEARRLGWSGKASDSLWGLRATNQKLIGGDAFRGPGLPANVQWLSADLDVSRGYRGNKRLIYSPESPISFISVDNYRNFVELSPCH